MSKKLTPREKGFTQGLFYAASYIVSQYSLNDIAENLLLASGIPVSEAHESDVSEYDLELLGDVLLRIRESKLVERVDARVTDTVESLVEG